MDGRRASRKTLRNSSVCRRTRRNWNAFSTMSAQLTMEKTIRMKRTTLAIGPEFQTRARIPELSVSLGTGAPLVCVQHIYRIITTSVGRAVVLPLLLASISMGVPVAAGQDARAAVEAFVARLPDVRISDLVIDQNLTLYHPGGRGPSSVGEQRMFFKLPQRQRLEQTVEGQREVQITVGDRVWVRRADGTVSEIPAAGPMRVLTHMLVPVKRLAADLLAEWRARGVRDDVSHAVRLGGRTITVIGARSGDRDVPAVWLDADYGVVRIVTRERLPNGVRLLDLTLSEHRPLIGGLYFPYRPEGFVDGELLILFTVRPGAINTNPPDPPFQPRSPGSR